MSEHTPMTDAELADIRGRLTGTVRTAFLHSDARRLLDEVDRLRELKCETCGMRVAHLNCNGYVIGWGCADGEQCAPASGMPHTPAQDAVTEYECPNCYRWAPWTDGIIDGDDEGAEEFWCQTCGSQTAVEAMESRPASEAPCQPAQEAQESPETPETGSGRGTGEREAHARPEAVQWGQGQNCPHRPEWHCETHGECRGCECGCDTVNPEPDPAWAIELVPGVWVASGRQNGKTGAAIAAAVEAAKPAHYLDAAADLRKVGHAAAADEVAKLRRSAEAALAACTGPTLWRTVVEGTIVLLDEADRLRALAEERRQLVRHAHYDVQALLVVRDELEAEVSRLRAEAVQHAADRDAYVTKTIKRYDTLAEEAARLRAENTAQAERIAAVNLLRRDDEGDEFEHIRGYCGPGCAGCWSEAIARALGVGDNEKGGQA